MVKGEKLDARVQGFGSYLCITEPARYDICEGPKCALYGSNGRGIRDDKLLVELAILGRESQDV